MLKNRSDACELLSVIDEVASKLRVARWDVFERLDTAFEEIAAGGSEEVYRSRPDHR